MIIHHNGKKYIIGFECNGKIFADRESANLYSFNLFQTCHVNYGVFEKVIAVGV